MKWANIMPRESPKATSINLPAKRDHLKFWEVGNQLVSTAFTELLFQVQHYNPNFIPGDNTVQKRPKCSFAMVNLDAFWSSVSCFGTHLVLTLLITSLSDLHSRSPPAVQLAKLSSYYRYREPLIYYAEEFACGGWLVSQIYSGVYRLNVEPENQRLYMFGAIGLVS